MLSKVWNPENQVTASNSSFGQMANVQHPGQQFSGQASAAHLTNYGNMVSAQERSIQHTAYNPEVTLNLPPPPPLPTIPHSSATLQSQGGHSLPSQTNQQLYQPEQYYVTQNNCFPLVPVSHSNLQISNTNNPTLTIPQVNPGPPTNNQIGAQPQHSMPLHVDRASQDFSSQGQQQNRGPGAAQAPEEDKSKKYQATLQLAQNLLLQLQQRGSGNQS